MDDVDAVHYCPPHELRRPFEYDRLPRQSANRFRYQQARIEQLSMDSATLVPYLDNPAAADEWLRSWSSENVARAHRNLVSLAQSGITLDLLAVICEQLRQTLPRLSDPDMALSNLERFVVAARSPLSLAGLFERGAEAHPTLLQIFSTSQYLSDWLIRDPESY